MEFIKELEGFLKINWNSYMELHLVNKCVITGIFGYFVLKVGTPLLKKLFTKLLGFPKLADDPKSNKYDPKKIYVHIFPRKSVDTVPNGSPFVMKLETWLRMKNIEYQPVETVKFSRATKQIPYIFHKGKEITDSDLIIQYLEKEFEFDSSEGLSLEQQATSRAYSKMIDENTLWTFVVQRLKYNFDNFKTKFHFGVPKLLEPVLLKRFSGEALKKAYVRGIGRKSPEEVYQIGKDDIKALSNFLRDKKFMMGDQMTKVDCTVFAHLCQDIHMGLQSPFVEFMKEDCTNLMPYLDRIKAKCWPDWDELSK